MEANESPLRVGVLGCAGIAWRRMLPAMSTVPQVRVAAIASREAAKAARFTARFGGEPVVGYQSLLDRPDIEAVYIALPAMLHAEWIERALRAGKHVLAEKPLTTTEAETAAMVGLADRSGLVLMESFMFLRHSQHATVRKLLADGAIGELRSLNADFGFPPKAADDIRYQQAVGGGTLTDLGVYPIRTALLHLGPRLEVIGATLRYDRARGVDLGGAALLATPDGVSAHLTYGMQHAYRSAYELWGSTGRVVVEWAYTPPATHPPVIRIEQQDRVERLTLPPDDQFANVASAFAAAVRHGGGESELRGAPVVALAGLVDRVRAASRVVDVKAD